MMQKNKNKAKSFKNLDSNNFGMSNPILMQVFANLLEI
jgi:hypothetical protein